MNQTIINEIAALKTEQERIKNRITALEAKGKDEFKPAWYLCHSDVASKESCLLKHINDETEARFFRERWRTVEPATAETLARFLPKPAARYDWSKAPEWANWADRDESGYA